MSKNNLQDELVENKPPPSKWKKALSVIFLILAVIYDISPVDAIPDVPIVGWLDDVSITMLAFSNFLEQFFQTKNETLSRLFGILKKVLLFVVIALIIILGLVFYGVFQL